MQFVVSINLHPLNQAVNDYLEGGQYSLSLVKLLLDLAAFGLGFGDKVTQHFLNNGSPEPPFETDEERTCFSTTLYIHPDFEKPKADEAINEAIKLAPNESRIREYVQIHPGATIVEVADTPSISKAPITRQIPLLR